jgi:hypothetical protein
MAVLAYAEIQLATSADTTPPPSTSTLAPNYPAPLPNSASTSPAQTSPSTANPGIGEQVTASLPWADKPRKTTWTRAGDLGINVTAVTNGVEYFVITPTLSCTASGVQIGESIVVTGQADSWTRLVITEIGQFGPDLQDPQYLPVTFQIT